MKWIATSSTAPWCEKVPQATKAFPQLTVTRRHQQTIDGFGGCFNELGWQTLQTLSEESRTHVLRALFDPANGCGFRLCRVPIGASDYALEWYSHNECDGDLAMEQFSIERDRRSLIPYIRAALSLQPQLRLFASPWSPPTWMKQPRVYNYGVLRWEPEILEAYALYLLKFVQAYQAEGLPVHQLHVQNEPNSDQKFPSCLWTGEKMRDFIREYLGPRFREAGIACEIWAGTIERADYDAWAHTILRDPHARAFVSGVGYQWAGKGAVQRTHQSWPELRLLQTESECGDGTNTWEYAHYVFTLLIGEHNFASSKKYREAVRHGRIAFVVDEVLPPWRPRFVEVRGTVQAFSEGGKTINEQFASDMLRLTPTYIVSFGINDDGIMPGSQQKVNYHGRKVE